jgi:signal transduction histidine kinase/ActR/RegA family two-component response regulator
LVLANLHAQVIVPSFAGRQLVGFFVIGPRAAAARAYGREEISALLRLAYGCAMALENAEHYQQLKATAQQLHSAQERLVQQERMVAAGRLAMGLAHEIKNPLAAIKTFAEFLPERYDDPSFRQEFSTVVQKEVTRIAQAVQGLSDFAKPLLPKLEPIDVQQILRDTVTLLSTQCLKQRVTVTQQYEHDPILVQANPNQLKQVCLNLCVNALDAMPHGGTLTVACGYRDGDALLYIRDTGTGIAEEHLPQLFDPFFTTKPNGMGLGLAVVKQILEQHFGKIRVDSRVGAGTTFEITLPWAVPYRERYNRNTDLPTFEPDGPSVPLDLLVVDDEPMIREQLQGAFELKGCHVRTAGSIEQALAAVAAQQPQLVLLDLKLEDEQQDGGQGLLQRLRTNWPLLPIIVVTGTCTDEATHQRIQELGALECYHKPVDVRTLQRKVFQLAAQLPPRAQAGA